MNNDIEFDLPGFLHSEIYPHMETGELDVYKRQDRGAPRSTPRPTGSGSRDNGRGVWVFWA